MRQPAPRRVVAVVAVVAALAFGALVPGAVAQTTEIRLLNPVDGAAVPLQTGLTKARRGHRCGLSRRHVAEGVVLSACHRVVHGDIAHETAGRQYRITKVDNRINRSSNSRTARCIERP